MTKKLSKSLVWFSLTAHTRQVIQGIYFLKSKIRNEFLGAASAMGVNLRWLTLSANTKTYLNEQSLK